MIIKEYENQIIDRFKANPKEFHRIQDQLNEIGLKNHFVTSAEPDVPMPAYCVPIFLEADKVKQVYEESKLLVSALEKIRQEYYQNKTLADFIGLSEEEQRILRFDTWARGVGSIRFDAFLDKSGGVKFVEVNTDFPDATVTFSRITREYIKLPHLDFIRDKIVEEKMDDELLVESVISQYKLNGGQGQPTVGIFAPQNRWWVGEFKNQLNLFRKQGLEAHIIDPDNMSFVNGQLASNGQKIDLVRRSTELVYFGKNFSKLLPFLESCQNQDFVLYNSFQDRILGYKTLFAVLHDKRWQNLFSSTEKETIKKYIPKTYRIESNGQIYVDGQMVGARDFLNQGRVGLVVKPGGLCEGCNVFIGASFSESAWVERMNDVVNQARHGEIWVVQEKIDIPMRQVFYRRGKELNLTDVHFDLVFYLFGAGERLLTGPLFSRASAGEIVNVSQGGVAYPVFQV